MPDSEQLIPSIAKSNSRLQNLSPDAEELPADLLPEILMNPDLASTSPPPNLMPNRYVPEGVLRPIAVRSVAPEAEDELKKTPSL
jgi:hypothetical protein